MSDPVIGLIGFAGALLLTLCGVPVAISMAIAGVVGFAVLRGMFGASFILSSAPFEAVFPYSLSVIPMFVAMGVYAAHSGLSRGLFDLANALVGRIRGGLAIATIGACALFGAICGSSLATAATMGRVAVPEMRRAGYADSISAATVAAAGTLGVLIPPSVLLVIYAILTETSIGALFIGALIPGVLAILLYAAAVIVTIRLRPDLIDVAKAAAPAQAATRSHDAIPAVGLFVVVIGGLYLGLFSPTEAAAVGAVGAFLLALFKRASLKRMIDAALETTRTSAMIFFILIGAALFNFFLESTGIGRLLSTWVTGSGYSPTTIMLIILLFYIILGCFMDALSMILLTVPVIFPIVIGLGYDPIWFGIIVVSVAEIGLITPPIGINLFVIQGVVPGLRQSDVMRGVVPFVVADIIRVLVLLAFPALVLFLPGAMR
jgi:tripartite ATP-independent transporter DctM subunit